MADARAAERAARRAARQAARSGISDEISEILPSRRRDRSVDAAGRSDGVDSRHDDNYVRQSRPTEIDDRPRHLQERDDGHDRGGGRPPLPRQVGPAVTAVEDDTELRAAAPRTPAFNRTRAPSSSGLAQTLGYAPGFASDTMPTMASTYFPRVVDQHAGMQMMMMNGGAQPPPLPPSAAGAANSASNSAAAQQLPVYEESIATGKFRKMHATNAALGKGLGAASYLRNQVAKRIQAAASATEIPDGQDTPLSAELRVAVAAGCRIAQGLLAGIALLVIIQACRLTDNSSFLRFYGDAVSPLRFTTWVVATISWLGAADQVMQAAMTLGRFFPPFQLTTAASVTLSKSVRFTYGAAVCYSIVMATVLWTMPADNAIRSFWTKNSAVTNPVITADVSNYIDVWRTAAIVRFVFVFLGWLCVSWSSASPSQVYIAVQEASDLELAAAGETIAAGLATRSTVRINNPGAIAPSMAVTPRKGVA